MTTPESQLEQQFVEKLRGLKYEYRPDIRDRAVLEDNFREKFETLNRVRLTEGEFPRLLEEIITPDVYTAARALRTINSFKRDDVSTSVFCDQTFQLVAKTDFPHPRKRLIIIINLTNSSASRTNSKFWCVEHVSISCPKASLISNSRPNPPPDFALRLCKPMNFLCLPLDCQEIGHELLTEWTEFSDVDNNIIKLITIINDALKQFQASSAFIILPTSIVHNPPGILYQAFMAGESRRRKQLMNRSSDSTDARLYVDPDGN